MGLRPALRMNTGAAKRLFGIGPAARVKRKGRTSPKPMGQPDRTVGGAARTENGETLMKSCNTIRFGATGLMPVLICAALVGCDNNDMLDPDGVGSRASAFVVPLWDLTVTDNFPNRMTGDGDATIISEFTVDLTAGQAVAFETTATSAGGIPVLHLFEPSAAGDIAVSEPINEGADARLVHTPAASGTYRVVVRALGNGSAGTCDVLMDGAPWQSGVEFGGWHIFLGGLRAQEQLQTVRLPNGALSPHLLFVLDADAARAVRRARGGGIAGAAELAGPTPTGDLTVVVGVPQGTTTGRVRFIRNDVAFTGHDPDGDGLGSELEAALGTCSVLSGFARGPDGNAFDCSLAADARDTDGDGISDGWEVLGRRFDIRPPDVVIGRVINDVFAFGNDDQALPLWGANPRHKDLFMEVDFMRRCRSENDADTVLRMSPAAARHFAAVYGDEFTDDSLARSENAMVLNNPDGEPGISAHLDIGVPPERPEDAAIYGDWGGFNAVDAVVSDTTTDCHLDGVYWKGANPNQSWKANLSPARIGIFRYTPGYPTGGGQCGNSFACAFNFRDLTNAAHEMGHTMGLGHSGPYGATGPVDPNCKPNYPSIMNYAYLGDISLGFSDGSVASAPSLNNAALREFQGVSPSATKFLDQLEQSFRYYVDRVNGHVDWNRDGVIAPAGQTVRAYANFRPGGGGCEWTRYNRTRVGEAVSAQSPSMDRLGNRLYVFYSVLGLVQYTYSTSSWNCAAPGVDGCAGAAFADVEWAYMDSWGGVDVVRAGLFDPHLIVISIDADGNLWDARLRVSPEGEETLTQASTIPGATADVGDPSLARMSNCEVFLAYRGPDGNLRTNRTTCDDRWAWQGEQLALATDGSPIPLSTSASPAIVRAYLPHNPGVAALYGAFTAPDGRLDIWMRNSSTGRWEKTDVLETRPGPIEGRPAMAWVPTKTNAEYPGRFYLMYVSGSASYTHMARMMMSYARATTTPAGDLAFVEKVGMDSPFDNVWFSVWGLDLLFEPGVDTNLRSVDARRHPGGDEHFELWLRPKADGVHDFAMENYDDWEALGANLCPRVVNPGGDLSNPIACHE